MRAILTPEDLKRGDIIEPSGWYPLEIIAYDEKPAKSDGSTNCSFQMKIFDGDNAGAIVTKFFSEKALGFGKGLWAVLNLPKTADGGYVLTTELFQQTVGKKFMGYIKRGKNNLNGNDFNDIAEFKPLA